MSIGTVLLAWFALSLFVTGLWCAAIAVGARTAPHRLRRWTETPAERECLRALEDMWRRSP